jgi:hypothetical protein
MATDTVLADILKDMMKAFRKARSRVQKEESRFRGTSRPIAKGSSGNRGQKTEEWKPVKTKANKEKIKVETGPTSSTAARDKDVLVAAGWSKAVLSSLEAVRPTSEGVYLATTSEAKQLVAEVRSQGALAVLSLVEVGDVGKGTWLSVLVTDKNGLQQVRRRWLTQLGTSPVEYMPDAPKAAAVQVDTQQLVLTLSESECPPEIWKAAKSAP